VRQPSLSFVSLVTNKTGEIIVVMCTESKHCYYTIDGLRSLLSKASLEDRVEINSALDLMLAANPNELFIDPGASADLVIGGNDVQYER